MAKKHANKKPQKKGKTIKMANDNPKQEEKRLSPEEAMNKLVAQFKESDSQQRENILFNMNMRMGQALDGLNGRLDMLAGIVYKLPGVQEIISKMKEDQEKAMAAQEQAVKDKQKEGDSNEQSESRDSGSDEKSNPEPELSTEGATSESK